MTTSRTIIDRSRRGTITRETLTLFVELERVPQRRRDRQTFKDAEHELARRLDLVVEWWSGCSVLDRDARPCWPEGLAAHAAWNRVRQVRQLLEAARAEQGRDDG